LTTVFLVRHCDVENPQRVMYGHLPGFGLSALGAAQAEALGEHLADRGLRQVRSSPLQRAQETAAAIARHAGGLEVVPDEDLVEARFGHYLQGVPYSMVPFRRPRWFVHYFFPGALPDDEGPVRMAARVARAVERARLAAQDASAVCVSHADPVQSFWIAHLGRRPRDLHRYPVAKGGYLELTFDGEVLRRVERHAPLVRTPPEPVAT
jgi:broad specificity phosphatase PhoE